MLLKALSYPQASTVRCPVAQREKVLEYELDYGKEVLPTLFNLKGIHPLEISSRELC